MGTGKSAVGRRLARRLKRKFIDTDTEIEKITGKTVAQIFARDGVTRFRSEEALLVKKIAAREGLVIATGGGLVLNPENVRLLKENGILVALTAAPEVIYNRVRRKKNRPLLFGTNIKTRIQELLEERRGAYGAAELTLDTGTGSIDGTVEKIISYLLERNQI
ncbi:MAG: Shikimate kinase [Firmicutes bacterium ADurb.Bin456]|nr:MAG: Shikimate kinase [Firmicutes bacterium ADurb.Bin456]